MHTLFKANLLARAGLHCLSNLITNAHGEKVNIVLTEFGYLRPTSSASLNTVESNCLLYVPTVIRFSRALINVMGECFSNHIIQWCGNKYEIEATKMSHFFLQHLWWLSAISPAAWSRKHIWTELIPSHTQTCLFNDRTMWASHISFHRTNAALERLQGNFSNFWCKIRNCHFGIISTYTCWMPNVESA